MLTHNYLKNDKAILISLVEEEICIVKILIYSDIFQYPLKLKEIQERFPKTIETTALVAFLDKLERLKLIEQQNGFYALNQLDAKLERRLKGNLKAEKYIKKAQWISNIIGNFPFVRAVYLSGSLSKNYADEKSDIDYFIITMPRYLWFVRTLFILFKKTILLGQHKWACFNYIIDADSLVIPQQNIYTATEIVTLLPTYDDGINNSFFKANDWIKDYFPNFGLTQQSNKKRRRLKRVLEFLLDTALVRKLDSFLMNKTKQRRIKRFGKEILDNPYFNCNFTPSVAKDHIKPHHQTIMDRYTQKILDFEAKHQVKLSAE